MNDPAGPAGFFQNKKREEADKVGVGGVKRVYYLLLGNGDFILLKG